MGTGRQVQVQVQATDAQKLKTEGEKPPLQLGRSERWVGMYDNCRAGEGCGTRCVALWGGQVMW